MKLVFSAAIFQIIFEETISYWVKNDRFSPDHFPPAV